MIIIAVALGSSFLGKFISNKVFICIANRLHKKVVEGVINSIVTFFEANPQGRILNRFSKDVATLDHMVFTVLEMMDYTIKVLYSISIVVYLNPWLAIFVAVSLVYLVRLRRKTLIVTRDPIRMKYSLMSPVNSLI